MFAPMVLGVSRCVKFLQESSWGLEALNITIPETESQPPLMKLKPWLLVNVLVCIDESRFNLLKWPPATVRLSHSAVEELKIQVLLCSLASSRKPPKEYSAVWSASVKKVPAPRHWDSTGAGVERSTLLEIMVLTGKEEFRSSQYNCCSVDQVRERIWRYKL